MGGGSGYGKNENKCFDGGLCGIDLYCPDSHIELQSTIDQWLSSERGPSVRSDQELSGETKCSNNIISSKFFKRKWI